MKLLIQSLLLSVGATLLFSCANQKSPEKLNITNRWVLRKTNVQDTNSLMVFNLQENGYFMIYDSIINKKFKQAGIPKIQVISKGQWKIENDTLVLNYQKPTDKEPKNFFIKTLTKNELFLSNNHKVLMKYTAL